MTIFDDPPAPITNHQSLYQWQSWPIKRLIFTMQFPCLLLNLFIVIVFYAFVLVCLFSDFFNLLGCVVLIGPLFMLISSAFSFLLNFIQGWYCLTQFLPLKIYVRPCALSFSLIYSSVYQKIKKINAEPILFFLHFFSLFFSSQV